MSQSSSQILFIFLMAFSGGCQMGTIQNRTLVFEKTSRNLNEGIETHALDYFMETLQDTLHITGYPDSSAAYFYSDTIFVDSLKNEILKVVNDTSFDDVVYISIQPFILRKEKDSIYYIYRNNVDESMARAKWYSLSKWDTLPNCSPFFLSSNQVTCDGANYYTGRDSTFSLCGIRFKTYVFKEIYTVTGADKHCYNVIRYIDKKTLVPIISKYYYLDDNCANIIDKAQIYLVKVLPLTERNKAIWRKSF